MPHKVLHFLSTAAGGLRRHVTDLVTGLNKGEFKPLVAAAKGNTWLNDLARQGIPVISLDFFPGQRSWQMYRTLRNLMQIMHGEGIEILHAHGFKAAFWGRLVAPLAGAPLMVYTVHNHPARWPTCVYMLERLQSRWTDKIITVSASLQEGLLEHGISRGKIVTIHNGVGVIPITAVQKERSHYNIALVGRLVSLKGVEYFLQAAADVATLEPRARFFVIGDGPLRNNLEALAHTLALQERVSFTGFQENLQEWWPCLDILVSCSLQEGLGLSILEAMAAAIPVIATNVGGIPEIIDNGKNGILIPPRNSHLLAKAILTLLHNPEERRRLGIAGRKTVKERFSLEKSVAAVEDLYRQLLAERGRYKG